MLNRRVSWVVLALFMTPVFCSVGSAQSIQEYVHSTWVAGVPYERTKDLFSAEDCDYLIDMIKDETEAPYWPHATAVMGIVGGARVYPHLVALVEGSGDDFSRASAVYSGRLSAVIALGHLASHKNAGYDEAMDYLLRHTLPSQWWGRNLRWVENFEDAVNLSIWTVHALSLSGRDEAFTALKDLAENRTYDRTRSAAESALVSLAMR